MQPQEQLYLALAQKGWTEKTLLTTLRKHRSNHCQMLLLEFYIWRGIRCRGKRSNYKEEDTEKYMNIHMKLASAIGSAFP